MNRNDIMTLTRKKPFIPLRLFTTDSQIFETRHPDEVLICKNQLVMNRRLDNESDDRLIFLPLIHIKQIVALHRHHPSPASK